MSPSTAAQQRTQDRFESVIGLAAPFLDLLLAAGERVSRIAGREDDYIPIRAPGEGLPLERPRPRQLAGGE